jgi:hypothetical protein
LVEEAASNEGGPWRRRRDPAAEKVILVQCTMEEGAAVEENLAAVKG